MSAPRSPPGRLIRTLANRHEPRRVIPAVQNSDSPQSFPRRSVRKNLLSARKRRNGVPSPTQTRLGELATSRNRIRERMRMGEGQRHILQGNTSHPDCKRSGLSQLGEARCGGISETCGFFHTLGGGNPSFITLNSKALHGVSVGPASAGPVAEAVKILDTRYRRKTRQLRWSFGMAFAVFGWVPAASSEVREL
jgi:hypothetical protein